MKQLGRQSMEMIKLIISAVLTSEKLYLVLKRESYTQIEDLLRES